MSSAGLAQWRCESEHHWQCQMKPAPVHWAAIEDDFLICQICGFKEWTREYCPVCVNEMLLHMQLFADHWDISESGRKRLYEQIVAEHTQSVGNIIR